MIRVWAANRRCFDLFPANGVWQVSVSDPDSAPVPIATRAATDTEVARAFLWHFGAAIPNFIQLTAESTTPPARHPAAIPAAMTAALLLIAALPLDYGYYPFLRFAVTGLSIWVALIAHRFNARAWMAFAIAMAVLFNPLFPLYSTRAFWVPVDIGAAIAFVVAALTLGRTRRH